MINRCFLMIITMSMYVSTAVGMKLEVLKGKDDNVNIYEWRVLMERTYTFDDIADEALEITNQQEARMLIMKSLRWIMQSISSEVNQFEDDSDVKTVTSKIFFITLAAAFLLTDIYGKIRNFFNTEEDLLLFENSLKILPNSIMSLMKQEYENVWAVYEEISESNTTILKAAWKIVFPHVRGG